MKKKLFFAAVAIVALASCSDNEFIGDNSPTTQQENAADEIQFGFEMQKFTRGDIVGNAAATLLGNGFYVTGTKADVDASPSIPTSSPTTKLVFDNYLVHYGNNTAGTTESNTANWEYVGIIPGTGSYTNWVKLSSLDRQTIKYWDYSTTQYDFLAFSTGEKKAVSKTTFGTDPTDLQDDEIGVTKMEYGASLGNGATAYTFYIPTIDGLKNTYITDVTPVAQANYGKEVKLTFKNLGSKIRLALYETVPGYSVKDVQFYVTDLADASVNDLAYNKSTTAALISADGTNGFSTQGTAVVSFPKVGTSNSDDGNYNKASVNVTPAVTASPILSQTFGTLDYKKNKEYEEDAGTIYLGRNITEATFAGNSAVDYYQVVFPVTSSSALTLRVNYTLVSTDGSDEEIKVYGAKAVVPSTYTVWQPNYAYTYIFKISDNTNGWTTTDATKPAGLFPITFDAVVAEIKDVSGEQRTVTTVATPTITTYQQSHDKTKNEYSKTATGPSATPTVKNLYIQVMDNTSSPATLKTDLNANATGASTKKSLLYAITGVANPTEALVMDALQNQSNVAGGVITGRNSVVLIPATIDLAQTTIVNGVDDKVINLSTAGKVAMINMTSTAAGNYAYVYDYSDAAKTTKTFYQPNGLSTGSTIASGVKYITLTKLATITATTTGSEAADDGYIYFSKTTTDGTNYTYSYYSVDGKTGNLPAGLLKVAKDTDLSEGDGSVTVEAGTFVFDIYTRNTGKYAVKVIKIV